MLLVAISAAACGSTAPASSGPPASAPAASARPATAAPATPSAPPRSSLVGSPAAAILADPSLLDALPAAAAGLKLIYDADTTASVMADPTLARDASAIATGLATPTGSGDRRRSS